MKLAARDLNRYLGGFGPAQRAAFVFGDDRGAAHEYAQRIAQTLVPDLSDPFNIALIDGHTLGDDPRRLDDELAALSLTGGRRLVWVRDVGERQRTLIEGALETVASGPPSGPFLLIEAGDLPYRSALRQLFENHPAAAALACEGGRQGDVEALIKEVLSQAKRNIAPDGFALLVARLGNDRAMARGALETLAHYMNSAPANAMITADDVRASVPDAGEAELDDIINTLLDGAIVRLDDALTRALAGGNSAIGLIRIAQRSFQRLHWVMRQAEAGHSPEQAVARLRPPLPRYAQSAFAARCRRWSPRAIELALQRLVDAELDCKTTALPEDIVCARAFLAIASMRARENAASP